MSKPIDETWNAIPDLDRLIHCVDAGGTVYTALRGGNGGALIGAPRIGQTGGSVLCP